MRRVKLNSFYRLLIPRLTIIVTTVDEEGRDNAAPFSFVMPVSFEPPLVSFACVPRWHTYINIKSRFEFVINIPTREMVESIVICGKSFSRGISEIEEASLTRMSSKEVVPPRIKEAAAWLECCLSEDVPAGDHHIIIGKVLLAEVKDEFWTGDRLNVEEVLNPLHISGNLFSVPGETVEA